MKVLTSVALKADAHAAAHVEVWTTAGAQARIEFHFQHRILIGNPEVRSRCRNSWAGRCASSCGDDHVVYADIDRVHLVRRWIGGDHPSQVRIAVVDVARIGREDAAVR
jgi:hypothetical protein